MFLNYLEVAMKKILFLILLVGTTVTLFAKQQILVDQENLLLKNKNILETQDIKCNYTNNSSFNYKKIGGSIALVIPLFDIGVGHREKYNDFAIDTSLDLSTLVLSSSLEGELKFLKYFDNTYVGGGFSAGASFVTVIPVALQAKPFITVGKENKKNFHEIDLSMIGVSTSGITLIPTIKYSYGLKF